MPKRCNVLHCKSEGGTMHTFPDPKKREIVREWLAAAGNKKLLERDYKKLSGFYYICRKHFAPEYLMFNNRIASTAIPTLHLPDPIEVPANMPPVSTCNEPVTVLPENKEDDNCKLISEEVIPVKEVAGGGSSRRDLLKLSGAAKRKLQRLRKAYAAANPGAQAGSNGVTHCLGVKRRKRILSEGSTPSDYKEFDDNLTEIQLAIVPAGFPNDTLSGEQAGLVKNQLLTLIDQIMVGGLAPRFYEVSLTCGVLKLSCADEDTHTWLKQVIPNCQPWEGSKLKIVNAEEVPTIRTMLWIPGLIEAAEKILHRLSVQNPSLKTQIWKVLDRKMCPKGQQLTIAMDEISWKTIQEKYQGRPYLNFSRVVFKTLNAVEPSRNSA